MHPVQPVNPLADFWIFRSARNALESNSMLKRSHLVLLSRRVGGSVGAQRTVIELAAITADAHHAPVY